MSLLCDIGGVDIAHADRREHKAVQPTWPPSELRVLITEEESANALPVQARRMLAELTEVCGQIIPTASDALRGSEAQSCEHRS